jgi:hypothetical protein
MEPTDSEDRYISALTWSHSDIEWHEPCMALRIILAVAPKGTAAIINRLLAATFEWLRGITLHLKSATFGDPASIVPVGQRT